MLSRTLCLLALSLVSSVHAATLTVNVGPNGAEVSSVPDVSDGMWRLICRRMIRTTSRQPWATPSSEYSDSASNSVL
jgi:hypothetical protein